MATRPLPEAAESRYAPYIEELHEFFATSGIPFGSPDDIFLVADRLQAPGSFSEDLGSLIRSMVLREGGAMPHAQLLEIMSLAIAGPELAREPQQYREPLRQLLAFVSGVMRRPWNVPSSETAEVVPFPSPDTSPRTAEPETFTPRVAVFEKMRGEQIRERHAESLSQTVSMPIPDRPDTVARASTHPVTSTTRASQRRLTPLQRNFLLGAGGLMALAAVLTFLLRPTPPSEVFQVGPVPTEVTAPAHTAVIARKPSQPDQAVASSAEPSSPVIPVVSGQIPVVRGQIQDTAPAKPSSYRQSSDPQLNRRPKPAVSAWPYSTPQPASQTQPTIQTQSAVNTQTTTGAYSADLPGAPPTAYPSSVGPNVSEASAAPIARRPMYRDPDASIAGDLPAGQSSAPSSPSRYFTVSSGVMASYLISHPDPEYPTLARLAHIQGQVIMQAVVSKDGSVSTVRVLRGNRLLRGAAEEAVRHWRYRPYRFGGKAIDVATIVTVDFHNHN